ncbi:23183_t:CDS:2 [Dentiscutata erythropus]|uniref:23183_t:CDS:1 n=1 Tax=Dentiscutata erythropus TaxID=1348616 RepID=A0A9N9G7B2_9GLOM|nr:23183_t:CDS:2 [Dentiscutata erythropus]
MSEPSKTGSTLNYYGGAAKETLGKVVGSKKMEAEGKEKKTGENKEYEAAKAAGKTEGSKDEAAGEAKKSTSTGSTLGDAKSTVEGKATEMKGQAERKANE